MFDSPLDILNPVDDTDGEINLATGRLTGEIWDTAHAKTRGACCGRARKSCCRHYNPFPASTGHAGKNMGNGSCCRTFIVSAALPFIIAWAYALYLGATGGLVFFKHTHWSLNPPKGSRSLEAKSAAEDFFFQKSAQYELSQGVIVTARHDPRKDGGLSVFHPAVANDFSSRILNATLNSCDEAISHNATQGGIPLCWWRNMHSVFIPDANAHSARPLFEDRDIDVWGDLMSPDNLTATMFLFDINNHFGGAGNKPQMEAWRRLQGAIDDWLAAPLVNQHPAKGSPLSAAPRNKDYFYAGTTHLQMMLETAQHSVISDFEHGDMITLPLAWFILLVSCGPSAILVLITLPVTLLCTLFALNEIAVGRWLSLAPHQYDPTQKHPWGEPRVEFPDFSPAIFINMIIAISLDYGLFMLKRYREEVRRGKSNLEAISVAVTRAGRVIFVSGATLGLTNFGLTFCSVKVVAAIGWGGFFACMIAVIVHLTLLPSLLAICGPCCRPITAYKLRFGRLCCDCRTGRSNNFRDMNVVNGHGNHRRKVLQEMPQLAESLLDSRNNNMDNIYGDQRRFSLLVSPTPAVSMWIHLGKFCKNHRVKLVTFMTLLMVPFIYYATQARLSLSQELLTPRDAPSQKALHEIRSHGIHASLLNPVAIIAYNVDDKRNCPDGWSCGRDIAPSAPYSLSPRCHDDDTSFMQIVYAMDIEGISHLPASELTCQSINSMLSGELCTSKTFRGYRIRNFVKIYCPGTCSNYCDAAGFDRKDSASIARSNANKSVLVPSLFSEIAQLRVRLQNEFPDLRSNDIRDITTIPLSNKPVRDVEHAFRLLSEKPLKSTPYQARFRRLTNYNHSAVSTLVVMPAMQSTGGASYLRKMRKIVSEESPWKDSQHGFYVFGDILPLVDAVDEVWQESPPIIAAVALVVIFVMSGVAFQSLLIPLRLLGTVAVTLAIVSGAIVFTYQFASGLHGEAAGIYWFVGLCSTCLVIGLTIDYDVFLISRIYEFRHQGYSTEASILRAMAKQSTTITTAGIIMTIAFSSLMLSDTIVLNQFGFVLVTASLADTFIVRTLLVPALMFFAVESNWWPGKVPPPLKTSLADFDDISDDTEVEGAGGAISHRQQIKETNLYFEESI